MMVLVEVLIV